MMAAFNPSTWEVESKDPIPFYPYPQAGWWARLAESVTSGFSERPGPNKQSRGRTLTATLDLYSAHTRTCTRTPSTLRT